MGQMELCPAIRRRPHFLLSPPRTHSPTTRSVPILGLTREYDSREIKIFPHRSLSREEALNPKSVRNHEDVRDRAVCVYSS